MQGIITGCDQNQEWLLPIWWEHYILHNSYPVLFIDFGMTEQGKAWCRDKGQCVTFSTAIPLKTVPPEKQTLWENYYGEKIWSRRQIWFKKPFALLHSPFPYSLWLDLDCLVQKSLDPLFNTLVFGVEIALKKDTDAIQKLHQSKGFIEPGEINYDCGLIAFRNDAPILKQWTEQIFDHNDEFVFDQQALSRAIRLHAPALFELPSLYNWSAANGPNTQALAIHFHGGALKQMIGDPQLRSLYLSQ